VQVKPVTCFLRNLGQHGSNCDLKGISVRLEVPADVKIVFLDNGTPAGADWSAVSSLSRAIEQQQVGWASAAVAKPSGRAQMRTSGGPSSRSSGGILMILY
jgi:hypothetical protein